MIYIKTTTEKIKPFFMAYETICDNYRETKARYRCAVINNMSIDLIASLKHDLTIIELSKIIAEDTLLQYAPKLESILNQ